jgi:hypothetical protein
LFLREKRNKPDISVLIELVSTPNLVEASDLWVRFGPLKLLTKLQMKLVEFEKSPIEVQDFKRNYQSFKRKSMKLMEARQSGQLLILVKV